MKPRPPRLGGRSLGLLILAIVVAGVAGSAASFYLAGTFPPGPVRDFFFKSLDFGIRQLNAELGFVSATFGLSLAISTFTVVLIALAVYLWYKL